MELEFEGEIWFWKGPSPFYFVTVPDEQSDAIKAIAKRVTYGWGVIPVTVSIGATTWTTSLFPKDARYLVPIRNNVRKGEKLAEGDTVSICMTVGRDSDPIKKRARNTEAHDE